MIYFAMYSNSATTLLGESGCLQSIVSELKEATNFIQVFRMTLNIPAPAGRQTANMQAAGAPQTAQVVRGLARGCTNIFQITEGVTGDQWSSTAEN